MAVHRQTMAQRKRASTDAIVAELHDAIADWLKVDPTRTLTGLAKLAGLNEAALRRFETRDRSLLLSSVSSLAAVLGLKLVRRSRKLAAAAEALFLEGGVEADVPAPTPLADVPAPAPAPLADYIGRDLPVSAECGVAPVGPFYIRDAAGGLVLVGSLVLDSAGNAMLAADQGRMVELAGDDAGCVAPGAGTLEPIGGLSSTLDPVPDPVVLPSGPDPVVLPSG